MHNIMVDLETLGTVPGSVILSIGAVAFDPTGKRPMDDGFYCVVNKQDCMDHYLSVDEDTEKWWERQSPEAQILLEYVEDPKQSIPLKLALQQLNAYVKKFGGYKDARVWGNGSDFDNALLAVAYRMASVVPTWPFWNNRCYRTLKGVCPGPKLERVGTYHNALDDARTQALHAIDLLKAHPGLNV